MDYKMLINKLNHESNYPISLLTLVLKLFSSVQYYQAIKILYILYINNYTFTILAIVKAEIVEKSPIPTNNNKIVIILANILVGAKSP